MAEAWIIGKVNPIDFRKNKSSDMEFINEYEKELEKIRKKQEYDLKIKQAMENMMNQGMR